MLRKIEFWEESWSWGGWRLQVMVSDGNCSLESTQVPLVG